MNTAVETVTATEPTVDYRLVAVKVIPTFERIVNGEVVGEPVTIAEPYRLTEDPNAVLSWGVALECFLAVLRQGWMEKENQTDAGNEAE